MRVRHPNAVRGESVDLDGTYVPVEDDAFEVPEECRGAAERWAAANDYDLDDLTVDEDDVGGGTCEAVKSDGEVCGRDLPCPYHSDVED